jgi:hypothetical protein
MMLAHHFANPADLHAKVAIRDYRGRPHPVHKLVLCHYRAVCFNKDEQYIHRCVPKFDMGAVNEYLSPVGQYSQILNQNHCVKCPFGWDRGMWTAIRTRKRLR